MVFTLIPVYVGSLLKHMLGVNAVTMGTPRQAVVYLFDFLFAGTTV